MYYCTCDCMSMCDYMLMYVLYVSVFVYCPIYCAGCLMKTGECLPNGQQLNTWASVYRVGVLQNKLKFHHKNALISK